MDNIYNKESFFNKYSEMSRSKDGLKGAADWPTLKKLLPDLKGLNILDLGCGYGWHCIYAKEKGAKKVIGIDISDKMLDVAKEKSKGLEIEYHQGTLSEQVIQNESLDLILSSLVIHYIQDYESLVKEIHALLKVGGEFVFNVEHPTFTAAGSQDWEYDEDGKVKHFPVDNYYYEGKREAIFLGEKVTKYHRTLTTYIMTLLDNNFSIEAVVEAKPTDEIVHTMMNELRRPMMLIIKARKIK